MAGKRRYEDGCAFAQGLDVVGERWALLVVRELMFGPKRFSDLKSDLTGIATNVLTQRLTDLEAAGVISRRDLPPPTRGRVYALTDWGRELAPVIEVMGRWSARNPRLQFGWPLSVSAAMMSLGSMFDPSRAEGVEAALQFDFGGELFAVTVADRRLRVDPGRHPAPQVTVTGDQNELLPVLYAGMPVAEAEANGLAVEGDREVLRRFATLFPMPDPAPLPVTAT
ncbi:transcriptional regulator [Rhodobacterales bacterium HKCCE2091]|nr:transcriptional regulator [Rhodobacterales bacterium HKCCE2091]